uniref:reverse transcriptase domain-containing protein n=1 Tax=Algoriphagus sp. TaxID=1872435 RepID=UPI004047DB5A
MKLEQQHSEQIKIAFNKMQSRRDLLQLLNEVKPLIYGKKTVPFEMKQLTYFSNPNLGGEKYLTFKIKKKSGDYRSIHAPIKGLKALQKTLAVILQCVYEPHKAAMGFVRDRSVVTNARLHVGNHYVYNIDLKDFFPSIDQARVWKMLQLRPFNLTKEASVDPEYLKWEDFKKDYLKTEDKVTFLKGKGRMFTNTPYGTLYVANQFDPNLDKYVILGNSNLKTKEGTSLEGTLWLVNKIPNSNRLTIANTLAALCCTEMEVERKSSTGTWEKVTRNVLPQGAPTSPIVTNIVCQKLDFLLTGVAKRFGLTYSRYADDITFSSMHNVYQPESEFLKELERIIAEQKFHIKESKTRLQKRGFRQEVTGLTVNENINVPQRYIKQLRMWLYHWERYGYDRAEGFFLQQYHADKGHVKSQKPSMASVIAGKLDYLRMVKGAENELYLKLKGRFDALMNTNTKAKQEESRRNHLNAVLNAILKNGLETAMEKYKKE